MASRGKCAVCGEGAGYYLAHAGVSYCPAHYVHYVEKKVKHGARETAIFKNARKLGFLSNGDSASLAVLSIMREIAGDRGIDLVVLKQKNENPLTLSKKARGLGIDKVITGHVIEDFIVKMLVLASEKKPQEIQRLNPKTGLFGKINGTSFPAPAFKAYKNELEEYATLKGIKGKGGLTKPALDQDFLAFIERLESEHPGTKHKMLKSLLYFSRTPA